MTTRMQSSATNLQTEDCPSTSPPLTSILIAPRVSTPELRQEANTELNNTHPPRPIDYQPSVNGRRSTRFTLHRLLSCALTLGLLDLISAILVFMLHVFSWFESDPPPYLRWLFDTDWDYLLDMTKQGALAWRAKNDPSASLGIIFVESLGPPGVFRPIRFAPLFSFTPPTLFAPISLFSSGGTLKRLLNKS
ncbi:hypothetical protein EV363DRAFT_1325497 [Boletus edulis]|nr:hypothetical protein EV363DRAFT_1325497 [Boletus edulis]